MDELQKLLQNPAYFGSGGRNSPEFNSFYRKFSNRFKKELLKLNATDIKFSKGHFYLSGFFKVGGQWFYFSLGDVRGSFHMVDYQGRLKLLVRTAQHDKDYTGGSNNYVVIEDGMYQTIVNTFNL